MIEIKNYQEEDCKSLITLFVTTIRTINIQDYKEHEIEAWIGDAQSDDRLGLWQKRFTETQTLVAWRGEKIVGFGNIENGNEIDMLFVHHDYQGYGVAHQLLKSLEMLTDSNLIHVHASITAKPFFEKQGYQVISRDENKRDNAILINYHMMKKL